MMGIAQFEKVLLLHDSNIWFQQDGAPLQRTTADWIYTSKSIDREVLNYSYQMAIEIAEFNASWISSCYYLYIMFKISKYYQKCSFFVKVLHYTPARARRTSAYTHTHTNIF